MTLKSLITPRFSLLKHVLSLLLLTLIPKLNAQCAGNDNSITVCDVSNETSKSVNLFSLLGSSAITGGVWIDNLKTGGLNTSSGVLNVQAIRNSGVFTYTYMVNKGGCVDSSIVTVTVGGYTGVTSSNVTVCGDDDSFNLFQAFDGNFLRPQFGGVWTDNSGTGALSGSYFDATRVPYEQIYSFTYTIPAIGTCAQQSATVFVKTKKPAIPGSSLALLLCNTDDLSLYKSLDLDTRLSGQDAGGLWSESGTGQLSGILDTTIDVQDIYNRFGAGTYNFTYTVIPESPVCEPKTTVFTIIIEDRLDFTGSKLEVNSDICENDLPIASYQAVLNRGIMSIPNGSYVVSYKVDTGTSTNSYTTLGLFSGGILTFNIDKTSITKAADYTVSISNIYKENSLRLCTNIIGSIIDVLHVNPIPKINNATVAVSSACKGFDIPVVISGNTNLSDGDYTIIYGLSGTNTIANQTATINVIGGVGSFLIPSNILPSIGNTTLSITRITNVVTGCTNTVSLNKVFDIKPLPDVSTLKISIPSICKEAMVNVSLSGLGTLTNINVVYKISGANVITNESIDLAVSSGNTSFTIPASSLNTIGDNVFTINSLVDNTNGCQAIVVNAMANFSVFNLPVTPTSNSFSVCKIDNPAIGDLSPNGNQFQWFDSATSTTPLVSTTPLISGTYYVKEVNLTTGCQSSLATINVVVHEVAKPILNPNGEKFCGIDKPTIQELTNNVTYLDQLVWYDAPINGNQVVATELLKEGTTYYGYNYSSSKSCFSEVLEVTVSLANCEIVGDIFIPDGFSPNGDGINDTFRIKNISFIYPDFSLEIFNRYGNLMFKGDRNKPEWDGNNSDYKVGIEGTAPNGVYFYVVKFNKGTIAPKQGKLYLNR
ncbi:gliding motility-associated C-terminal domain-containing protein [Flavobacterium faecale]|uniref:gliding motility-associated C-terminal domain-containing protein n=1 Tax=Flavobacterium faecale TaxID=1355330 RepID=UPI003AAE78A8